MSVRVTRPSHFHMPHRVGRPIFYPGVPVEYDSWEDVPEQIRRDHEEHPGERWIIEREMEESAAPPRRSAKKPKAKANNEPAADE